MNQGLAVKVNKLPAPTWNWLRMNGTQLKLGEFAGEGSLKIEKPAAIEERALADAGAAAGGAEALRDPEQVAGGMGEELEQLAKAAGVPYRTFACPAGVRATEPLRLSFTFGGAENQLNRLALAAAEDSELFVVMDFAAASGADGAESPEQAATEQPAGGAPACTALVQTKLLLQKNARIRLVQILHTGDGLRFLNDIGGTCAEGAQVELIQIVLGGRETYLGVRTELGGRGSGLTADAAYLLSGQQKLDMNYEAVHTGKKTTCEINASGVLRDQAFKLFRGTIDFRRGSAGSKGNEKEDVLILSDGVVNQTIPLILCQEEDVEGNHGATIGKLPEDLLFYLESRGMPQEAVYEMLARARIDAICRRIGDARTEELVQTLLSGGVEKE